MSKNIVPIPKLKIMLSTWSITNYNTMITSKYCIKRINNDLQNNKYHVLNSF